MRGLPAIIGLALFMVAAPWSVVEQAPSQGLTRRLDFQTVREAPEGGEARPVADVAIEVGVGSPIDPLVVPLARGVSDAEGRLRIEIPRSELESASSAGTPMWFRVASPGHQRLWRRLSPAQVTGSVRVAVLPGGSVIGRLTDEGGAPVSGVVRAATRRTRQGGLHRGVRVEAGADGWFQLDLGESGSYHVTADAGGAGSAAAGGVPVELVEPPQRLDLVARGPGIVRGQVVDGSGAAVSGLDLLVLCAEIADAATGHVPVDRESALLLQGRGRAAARGVTNAFGRFEASGLTDGPHFVWARRSRYGHGSYVHLLTPSAVAADGEYLQLCFTPSELAVRVRDREGSPWRSPLLPESRESSIGDPWPKSLELLVLSLPDADLPARRLTDDPPRSRGQVRWTGTEVEPGLVVHEVEPGRTYTVGLLGPRQAWDPVLVDVPRGAGRVEVELTEADTPPGELELTFRSRGDVSLCIEDPRTGTPLLRESHVDEGRGPFLFSLPAGGYRVVLQGSDRAGICAIEPIRPRRDGRFESLVHIKPGERARVEADLPAGAFLRLHLVGDVRDEDFTGLQELWEGFSYEDDFWVSRPRLWLLREHRWPQPVPFLESGIGWPMHSIPIGTRATSMRLPAGRFVLHGRMPGGRVATTPVELMDGQTTEATLAFD